MLSLDEAIKYCNEEAEAWKKDAERFNKHSQTEATEKYVNECAEEAEFHEQLAKWLEELKAYKACHLIQDECYFCNADKCHNGGQKNEND